MWIKRQVVMLPTNEKANIGADNWYLPNTKKLVINGFISNLYILSDEEIKEDNLPCYVYYKDGKSIQFIHSSNILKEVNAECKKIIATTDLSIAIEHDTLSIVQRKSLINHYPTEKTVLPQPSKAFIKKYVDGYNKSNVITDVMVEYENVRPHRHLDTLKVDSNNCITIKKVKDSWDRKEVEQIAWEAFMIQYRHDDGKVSMSKIDETMEIFKKWFEKRI